MAAKELLQAVLAAVPAVPAIAGDSFGSSDTTAIIQVLDTGDRILALPQYEVRATVVVEVGIRGARDDAELWDELERIMRVLILLPGYQVIPGSVNATLVGTDANDRVGQVACTYILETIRGKI